MIADVQRQLPGYRFHRAGNIEAHHDCVRFAWQAVPEVGPVFAGGTDIAVIVDGRFHKVTGFIDYLQPTQS